MRDFAIKTNEITPYFALIQDIHRKFTPFQQALLYSITLEKETRMNVPLSLTRRGRGKSKIL